MAANPLPEVKAITMRTHDLTTALSNEPVGVAGILLSKDLISRDIWSKMLLHSYTPSEKAAILVEAVGNTIEIAPIKFQCFLDILSDQICSKEVGEKLRSTYQSELTSLICDLTCHSRWVAGVKEWERLILLSFVHLFKGEQINTLPEGLYNLMYAYHSGMAI